MGSIVIYSGQHTTSYSNYKYNYLSSLW